MRRCYPWLLFGLSVTLLLNGCGSTEPTTRVPVKTPVPEVQTEEHTETTLTPAMMVARAQDIWQSTGDVNARNGYLLDAAQGFLANDAPAKASQISYMLRGQIQLPEQQNRYQLLLVELYGNDPRVGSAQRLELLQSISAFDPATKARKFALMATDYARLGQWLAAADALLNSDDANPEYVAKAWQWVNQASAQQLQDSARFTKLPAYVSLRQLILEHGFEPDLLRQQLAQYQRVFRNHPLVTHWPNNLSNLEQLSQTNREHIAVMLPLSGRLQVTGMAIKEGILAAYFNDTSAMNATRIPQLQFIDTNDTTADELITAAADADWIIGPLLKENVDALLPKLSPQHRILTLNRPEARAEQPAPAASSRPSRRRS